MNGSHDLRERLSGCMPLGFGVSGPLALPALVGRSTLHKLLDLTRGSRFALIDTAPAYGNGRAELRLGEYIEGAKTLPLISTKVGLTSSGLRQRHRDFDPDAIETSLRLSLHRLGRDSVDILWLHGPDPSEITPELRERLEEMRTQGLFTWLGAATRLEHLPALADTRAFEAIMCPVHAGIDAQTRASLLRLRASGTLIVGIEVMAPAAAQMSRGLSPSGLWRRLRREPVESNASSLSPIESLNWVLTSGLCDVAMVTTTKPDHLRANIAAARAANRPPA